MFRIHFFHRRSAAAVLFWLALLLINTHATVNQAMVPLPGSIKKVEAWIQSGSPNPHRPFISRSTLKPEENAATMPFAVALRLRNFTELQMRVTHGDPIPLS